MPTLTEMFAQTRASLSLMEAVNYETMFNDVFRFVETLPGRSKETENEVLNIKRTVAQARARLKKQDRIVWYLRLWKIGLLWNWKVHAAAKIADKTEQDAAIQRCEMLINKLAVDYAKKSGKSVDNVLDDGDIVYNDTSMLLNLEHFFSLPIVAIQNRVFGYDDPNAIYREFEAAETAWKEEAKGAFPDNHATPIIKFPDGFAWYDLGRAYCPKEAKAMGHCGNSPRQHSGDTILSLRNTIKRGDQVLHKPYLTFILREDGMLTEMKGRFNEKPEEDFHPHIIALLRNPMIRGIVGGGYKPENNFSLNDLSDDDRDALIEEKPELGGVEHFYKKYGQCDHVTDMIKDALDSAGMEPYTFDVEEDEITVDEWDDLERFVSDVDDTVVGEIVSILEDDGKDLSLHDLLSPDEMEFSIEEMAEAISALPDREYVQLMRFLGFEPVPHNQTIQHMRAVESAAERFINSSAYEDLQEIALRDVSLSPQSLEKLKARLKEYLDVGYYFEGSIQQVRINPDDISADVKMVVSYDDMVKMVAAGAQGEDDYDYDEYYGYYRDINHHGWTTVEWDYVNERRKEQKLSSESNKTDPFVVELIRTEAINLPTCLMAYVHEMHW